MVHHEPDLQNLFLAFTCVTWLPGVHPPPIFYHLNVIFKILVWNSVKKFSVEHTQWIFQTSCSLDCKAIPMFAKILIFWTCSMFVLSNKQLLGLGYSWKTISFWKHIYSECLLSQPAFTEQRNPHCFLRKVNRIFFETYWILLGLKFLSSLYNPCAARIYSRKFNVS